MKKSKYDPARQRERQLARYGLTGEQFAQLLASQGGGCAVCGGTTDLCVDHDHTCCPGRNTCGKCVRGLLCSFCNRSIGMMADSSERLRSAADYLDARIGQMDWVRQRAASICACAPEGV